MDLTAIPPEFAITSVPQDTWPRICEAVGAPRSPQCTAVWIPLSQYLWSNWVSPGVYQLLAEQVHHAVSSDPETWGGYDPHTQQVAPQVALTTLPVAVAAEGVPTMRWPLVMWL